jgi:hypothetical protein
LVAQRETRAAKLSAEQRQQIASMGGKARWKDKDQPKTKRVMNDQIEKDRLFNELRRQFLTRTITLEQLLKRLPEAGERLGILQDHEGRWACAPLTWARYEHNETGSFLEMWIPKKYWKDTARAAVIYALHAIFKERNNTLFEEDSDSNDEV